MQWMRSLMGRVNNRKTIMSLMALCAAGATAVGIARRRRTDGNYLVPGAATATKNVLMPAEFMSINSRMSEDTGYLFVLHCRLQVSCIFFPQILIKDQGTLSFIKNRW